MKKLYVCLAAAFSFSSQLFSQAVYRSDVPAGNWNSSLSWFLVSGTDSDADGVPDADDDVFIQAGNTITLTAAQECKNLNISTGTTGDNVGGEGAIALFANNLHVYGKLRCYFAPIGDLTSGTSSTAGYSVYPFTGTGHVTAKGNSRAFTVAGEWSDAITNTTTTSFIFYVDMNAGQTITLNTGIKCTLLSLVNGNVDIGANTVSLDNGFTGGSITIGAGTTLSSSASGVNTFQRNATSPAGTLTINPTGKLVLTGAAPKLQVLNYTLSGTVEYGGAAQTWADKGTDATTPGNTPILYTNVTLSNSGVKTSVANTNLQVSGTFSLQGTATFALGATSFIQYFPGSNLEYAGSVAQTSTDAEFPVVSGPASLTINNNNGVTLHAARTVTTNFALTNGTLTTTSTNLLTLAAGLVVLGSSNTSFVNGPLKKIGNTNFIFPIGKTGFGKVPLELSNFLGGTVTDAFTAEYVRSNPRLINNSLAAGLDHISMIDYWNFENSGTGTPTVDVTLYWTTLSSSNGSVSYINEFLDLRATRYNSITTAWDIYGGTVVGGSNFSDGSILWPNVTMLATPSSPFSLASITTMNPLPVTFNYLTAIKQSASNLLEWKLSCGSSTNVQIELQRAGAGKNYAAIQTMNATALRCQQPFSFTDAAPLAGTNNYRIKVTDANGKISYSTIAAIINSDGGFEIVNLLPSLVTSSLQVNLAAAKKTTLNVVITDAAGRPVTKAVYSLVAGSNLLDVNVGKLAAGMYYLTATTAEGDVRTVRFVKQ